MCCCWHEEPRCRPSFNDLLDKIITIRKLYEDLPNLSKVSGSNMDFTGSYEWEPTTKCSIFHSDTCRISLTDLTFVVAELPGRLSLCEDHHKMNLPTPFDDGLGCTENVLSNCCNNGSNVCNLGESVRRFTLPSSENMCSDVPDLTTNSVV